MVSVAGWLAVKAQCPSRMSDTCVTDSEKGEALVFEPPWDGMHSPEFKRLVCLLTSSTSETKGFFHPMTSENCKFCSTVSCEMNIGNINKSCF